MLTFNEIIESFSRTTPRKVFLNDEIRKLSYKGLGAYGVRVTDPKNLEKSIYKAVKNTPSVVDVITSSTAVSSDAIKGLGVVPKYQALDIWDDLEKKFRKED